MRRLPSGWRAWPLAVAVSLALCLAMPAVGGAVAPRTDRTGLPAWVAPAVDVDRLRLEDAERPVDARRPYRVGFPMAVDLSPSSAGAWEELPAGGRLWRLQVETPGALWLVLGFDEFRLSPGAELRVYASDRGTALGPFTFEDVRPHGELWLPPVDGDSLILELQLSAATAHDTPALHLGTVSHGYRPWGAFGASQALGAGGCHQDINCLAGEDWQRPKRGVVLLLMEGAGSCTGSLVNNTSLDCTPYVLTAKHCLDGEADLNGLTFQFHHELPACEPGLPAVLVKTGAVARASYTPTDFQLVEMSDPPDAGWNVFFNGWSRAVQAASESWTIHHPLGAVKKITHDADPLVDGIDQGPDHWRVNQWEEGSTDPGSSGGPLFDPDQRIVGQLDLDTASCGNPGGFAEYGKVDVSWNQGLGTFLDPLSCDPDLCGATVLDGMDQSFCGSPSPGLSHVGHVVDDGQGSGGGEADPGETFELEVQLFNDGPLEATGISGTLSTNEPLVTIVDGTATWPDVSPYETQPSDVPHFTVSLDLAFPCGESIPLELSISSSEGSWQSDFLVPTGTAVGLQQPAPFEDDMESGTNGWTESTPLGSAPWSLISGESNSPTHSWFAPNVTGIGDSVLSMPTIAEMPPRASLSFAHRMLSEPGDGGVLEYSTDGLDWLDAGDRITTGPYNSIIPTNFGSPISGRAAWAGDLGGWRTVQVDLSFLEGRQVMLRWRFASDMFSADQGWYVDDVVLSSPDVLCLPCADVDNDGFCPSPVGNDCDDDRAEIYPGAPQICDGLNNDCNDPAWPSLTGNEADGDADGSTACEGDCNGADSSVHPLADEICDGRDNDCDGLVDNDAACDLSCDQAEIAGGDILVTDHPSSSAQPAVVWTGAEFGVAWNDARDGNFEIYFSRLDPFGQVTAGELRLTNAAADSINASLVWTGSGYAVSWCDERSGPLDAYFARLDTAGNKLGADVLLGGGCQNNGITSLAWNGSEYAVAWVDSTQAIRFARVDASGLPTGEHTQLSGESSGSRYPSLVWSGAEYGVAWHANDGSFNQIYFTRVDAFGNEIGVDVAVTSNSIHSRLPSLVWDGTGYGVTWNEGTRAGGARFIHFVRLDASGSPLDPSTQVTAGQTGSQRPTIAWSGAEYGLIWRDLRDGNGEVYFARIDAAGSKIGVETRLTDSAASSVTGNVVWTGTEFGMVWSETPEIHFQRLGCNCFDQDGDGLSDCNDNCSSVYNPDQSDHDADSEGDPCDLDDGLIYLRLTEPSQVEWQPEQGFDSWNLYKGDLDVLRASGIYTQVPGSNDLADRQCGLSVPSAGDAGDPDPGKTAFFLATGVSVGVESGLGQSTSGERPNDNPCP